MVVVVVDVDVDSTVVVFVAVLDFVSDANVVVVSVVSAMK